VGIWSNPVLRQINVHVGASVGVWLESQVSYKSSSA